MRNGPHRHVYLNSQSPLGGAVWRHSRMLEGGALRREMCHCFGALIVYNLSLISVCSLFVSCGQEVTAQFPAPETNFHA